MKFDFKKLIPFVAVLLLSLTFLSGCNITTEPQIENPSKAPEKGSTEAVTTKAEDKPSATVPKLKHTESPEKKT